MIRADDKISAVLARDERLVDVLAAIARPFAQLRNPLLRRTMASRVTVQQAAQIAGVDAAALVERLNRALGDALPSDVEPAPEARAKTVPVALPDALLEVDPKRFVDLDVRDDLRNGREPFARIMAAVKALAPDAVFRLRATFEPVPLYSVLAKKKLAHITECLADDDWRVWFYRDDQARAAPAAPAKDQDEGDVIILDVRDLEPPEPMVRTFEALAALPRGKTLVQLNVRVPQFLLPKLAERGFVYEIREQSADLVRVFIRHAS